MSFQLLAGSLHSAQYESLTVPRSLFCCYPSMPLHCCWGSSLLCWLTWSSTAMLPGPKLLPMQNPSQPGSPKTSLDFHKPCRNPKDFKGLLLCLIWLRVASEVPARQKAAPQHLCVYCNSLMAALTPQISGHQTATDTQPSHICLIYFVL